MQLSTFNERFRQIVFFVIILSLAGLIFYQLSFLIPGILGAVTLYVLNRNTLYGLIYKKKWNKILSVALILLFDVIILSIPFLLLSLFVIPKMQEFSSNANNVYLGVKKMLDSFATSTGIVLLSKDNLNNLPKVLSSYVPNFISSASNILINFSTMFFVLYFMLSNAKNFEQNILNLIPLKSANKKLISKETKDIVTSNAIGIPILALAQGFFAFIGYLIFGINDALLWGFVTSICSVIPFVGSSIIWIPLVIYTYASGEHSMAVYLAIYCSVVVLNIDNLLRMYLLKAYSDTHPLITLFGVIIGLGLFGFIGLVFGPLLISYLLLLVRIYINEFSNDEDIVEIEN